MPESEPPLTLKTPLDSQLCTFGRCGRSVARFGGSDLIISHDITVGLDVDHRLASPPTLSCVQSALSTIAGDQAPFDRDDKTGQQIAIACKREMI